MMTPWMLRAGSFGGCAGGGEGAAADIHGGVQATDSDQHIHDPVIPAALRVGLREHRRHRAPDPRCPSAIASRSARSPRLEIPELEVND
jgi:hypothetical protein